MFEFRNTVLHHTNSRPVEHHVHGSLPDRVGLEPDPHDCVGAHSHRLRLRLHNQLVSQQWGHLGQVLHLAPHEALEAGTNVLKKVTRANLECNIPVK